MADVVVQETNSQGDLLQLFRSGRASTRNDVRRVTGLARSTVAYKIEALLNAGFLIEDGSLADGRGRPSTRLRVNDHRTTVLAADLGMTHGRLGGEHGRRRRPGRNRDRELDQTRPGDGVDADCRGVRPALEHGGPEQGQPPRDRDGRAGSGRLGDRPDRPLDQHAGLGQLSRLASTWSTATPYPRSSTTTRTCSVSANSAASIPTRTWWSSSRSAPESGRR